MLAVDEGGLLIAEVGVGAETGGVVAVGRVVPKTGAVQVDPSIELDEDIFRGAVGAGEDGEGRAGLHHWNGGLVGVGHGSGAGGVAAIGEAFRIEGGVAIPAVLAGDGDAGNFFKPTGSGIGLIEGERGGRPEGGKLRGAVAEDEVASRGDNHRGEVGAVETAHVGATGVLVEIGVAEAVGETARLTRRGVVIHHHHHGDFVTGVTAAGGAVGVAVVASLESDEVAVGPAAFLNAAGEVVVDFENVGDAGIAELAEVSGVGVAREGATGFPERFRLVVAVRVNQAHAFPGHVVGVLPLLLGGKITIMAVGVGDAHALGKSACSWGIKPAQGCSWVAKYSIQLATKIVIDEPHTGVPVAAVAGRLAEVFAEDHGVVPGPFVFKDGVAMVGVAEAAGEVELALNAAEVAGVTAIFVGSALLAEKVVGDVFDGVEAQAVGLEAVDFVAGGADEVGADILGKGGLVRVDIILCLGGELGGGGVGAEFGAGPIDEDAEVGGGAVGVLVVLLGAGEVADEGVFGMGGSLAGAVIGVGGFVGDVDEVSQAEVLHLPTAVPIAGVVPFAVEAVLGFSEVKILGHHAGIDVDGGVFVVAGHVEGPVVHDVVEVDADAKAVGDLHHVEEFRLGAVAGADRIALVLGAKIERIPEVITDGETARAFGGGREPEGVVAGLGDLRHFLGEIGVGDVEELEHGLGANQIRQKQAEERRQERPSRAAGARQFHHICIQG